MSLAQLYPFSTQDGKTVPLDIIKPAGLLVQSTALEVASFLMPSYSQVSVIFSSTACLLRSEVTIPEIVSGESYPDLLFIPADIAMTVALLPDTTYYVKAIETPGVLYIQGIERWAGLGLDRQYHTKM